MTTATFEVKHWHGIIALIALSTPSTILPVVNVTLVVVDNFLSSPFPDCFPIGSPARLGQAIDSDCESILVPLTTRTRLPVSIAKIAELMFAWASWVNQLEASSNISDERNLLMW